MKQYIIFLKKHRRFILSSYQLVSSFLDHKEYSLDIYKSELFYFLNFLARISHFSYNGQVGVYKRVEKDLSGGGLCLSGYKVGVYQYL